MILAQLPDPQLQPLLYAKVTKYMLHGPCGADDPQAKCMVNGKYSKCFPKKYRERTDWAEDSYPLYARPDNGLVFECNGARFTNQYMVSYCPQLLLFDCHLNVEISAGLGTVKYLSKYIYKGPDRATMEISGGVQDEINIWIVTLLVQQKLAGRSLNLIYIESHQLSNICLSIFPMNTMSIFIHTRLSMKC